VAETKQDTETTTEERRLSRTYVPASPLDIPTDSALSGIIGSLSPEMQAAFLDIQANADANKAKKSGTYTRTEESGNIPTDAVIAEGINKVFRQYYGRDAKPDELAPYLAEAKSLYVDPKTGKTKSYITEIWKDGNQVGTKVLTAQKEDPFQIIENSVKKNIAEGKVAVNKQNMPEGPGAKYFQNLKQLAARNGINLSDAAALDYSNKIVAEQMDENTAYNTIRESAASAFPQFSDKIKAGVDLKTLADPYLQSMSNILEIPDTAIDLFDPTVRSALSYTNKDGTVGTKSLYDFETQLKNDPRWAYTKNARQSLDNVGMGFLRSIGLAY
jgi:hypothetical protein